jgi:perosamine synthetase
MSARIQVARPEMGEPEWRAVKEVIESGWVTQGPKVAEFERAMAEYCGTKHAVAVSSCTTALHLALVCAGVGRGDEVICPSMSFIATANAIVHAGATPVFAEVEPDTFNLDLRDAERRITSRTKAILLVHQLGLPADIDGFSALAKARGLPLVEDAACAIGSTYRGKRIGSHSEMVCFSFHPRKLVTTGDGGMITTDSEDHAARLRLLRQHGMSVPDTVRHGSAKVVREAYLEVGYNYRLTDIQAAVGIAQLRRLPEVLAKRRELAERYDRGLADMAGVQAPARPVHGEWNIQTYAVRIDGCDAARRDAIAQSMLDRGIATRPGVMTAHREPAYGTASFGLPVSEAASDGSLVIPLHSAMADTDADAVLEALRDALR